MTNGARLAISKFEPQPKQVNDMSASTISDNVMMIPHIMHSTLWEVDSWLIIILFVGGIFRPKIKYGIKT